MAPAFSGWPTRFEPLPARRLWGPARKTSVRMSSEEWHSLKPGRDSGQCSQQPKHRGYDPRPGEQTLKLVPFVESDRSAQHGSRFVGLGEDPIREEICSLVR